MKKMTNGVIYARVSSVGKRQDTSRQVADLSAWAERSGVDVVKVFEDHVSGAKAAGERQLGAAIDFCAANEVSSILVSEMSRLGRNVDDILDVVQRCKALHLNVHFLREGLDIFVDNGVEHPFLAIFVAVLGTVAEMERDMIADRLASGRKRYVETGGKLGRKVGSVKSADTKRIEYAKALRLLRSGESVRKTAKLCDISVSTVQRLKKEFDL